MSLEGQKATQIADERLPKPSGSSFVAICFLTKSFEKIIFGVLKDYAYKDDGEPGERNGSKAVVEAIAGKRPLMYDEYNLCEKAHINQLFASKAICLGKFTSILRFHSAQEPRNLIFFKR